MPWSFTDALKSVVILSISSESRDTFFFFKLFFRYHNLVSLTLTPSELVNEDMR